MGQLTLTEEYGAQARGQILMYLPEDLILVTDVSHPLYDPSVNDPVPAEFVKGVAENGVIEPVIVRRNGTTSKGVARVEVVDGRTRVKAARIVNKQRKAAGLEPMLIGAKLVKGMKDMAAETAMVICNEHRRIEDVVTRSEKLRRYLAHGHTEKQGRVHFGMKAHGFKVLMEVMEFGDAIKGALKDKKITMGIARTLAALPESEQAAALAETLKEAGGGRGEKAKAAAEKRAGSNGGRARPAFKVQSATVVLKALDTASCMPKGDYQKGVLDALEWMLGKKQAAWSGQS